MTYEYRYPGGLWEPLEVGESVRVAEFFRTFAPGVELRRVYASPRWQDIATATNTGLPGRLEALESRVSQLEAVREMGARTW